MTSVTGAPDSSLYLPIAWSCGHSSFLSEEVCPCVFDPSDLWLALQHGVSTRFAVAAGWNLYFCVWHWWLFLTPPVMILTLAHLKFMLWLFRLYISLNLTSFLTPWCLCRCNSPAWNTSYFFPLVADKSELKKASCVKLSLLPEMIFLKIFLSYLSNYYKYIFFFLSWKVKLKSLSRLRLFVTPWTVAYQAPPSMECSRPEYWSG